MLRFFIKKIGHQELGYKNSKSLIPGVSRGQYFLISKKYLDFFPNLSKEIPQDLQILNIVTHDSNLPAQAKYIYDNDKYHGSKANSPRDEHRINLNLKINLNRQIYLKDDIVIFKKETFLNEYDEEETAFVLTRYRESLDTLDYKKLTKLLETKKIGYSSRNYAYLNNDDLIGLKNHKERIFERVMSLDPIIPLIDNSLLKTKVFQKKGGELKTAEKQIKRIIFDKYDYKCLVSGIGYKWNEPNKIKNTWKGITGAHIKPRAHNGEYSSENIIPLIEPIHQLFDRGIFTICEDYSIKIHEKALEDPLLSNFHSYNKKKLCLPNGIDLSLDSIYHHNKEVFGNFVSGKQIRTN